MFSEGFDLFYSRIEYTSYYPQVDICNKHFKHDAMYDLILYWIYVLFGKALSEKLVLELIWRIDHVCSENT